MAMFRYLAHQGRLQILLRLSRCLVGAGKSLILAGHLAGVSSGGSENWPGEYGGLGQGHHHTGPHLVSSVPVQSVMGQERHLHT